MKVFKFGGASVNSIERIKNLGPILQEFKEDQLVVIISAMGKTTNALEKVAEAFFEGNRETALTLFHEIKTTHLVIAQQLMTKGYTDCEMQLADFFTEIEWLLHDKPVRDFDYYYDQVVCLGELLSTCILSHFLNEWGIANQWVDVRDLIRTDNNFRDANIDWETSTEKIQGLIKKGNGPSSKILITQGFIGATDDNESSTLGREGSDYTAAIFANIVEADSLTIWKDVAAVMNADPKVFPDAVTIPVLNYTEVIEMAYYGAQVIHPKTIKPLQNKGIPLLVKCFLDSSLAGTQIHNKQIKGLPPIIVLKPKQVLVTMTTTDFSFVGDHHMRELYGLMESMHLKPNLMQTGAISLMISLDDQSEKISKLAQAASGIFDVQVEKGLTLLTIRHYTAATIEQHLSGKTAVLQQQSRETLQFLY
ncbi:MAG: aspartate kinase [Sediminibacterium sp.]